MARVELGERIATLREEQALTQAELAQRAKISPSTLSLIESGRVPRPHVSTVRKIARALGVEPQDLRNTEAPTHPKVLRPRSLDELLERAGLETRWFTLPDEEFYSWWLGVDWKEAIRRFWEIDREFQVIAAEVSASLQDQSTVDPDLRRQLGQIYAKAMGRHYHAKAAAPGKDETEEDFDKRQHRQETRQFEKVEKPVEEVVARAS